MARAAVAIAIVAGLAAVGVASASPSDGGGAASVAPDAAAGSVPPDAFVAADCARCHEVPGAEPLGRLDSCTSCHVWIREVADDPARRLRAMELFPLWARYEQTVASYLAVPSLDAALARLEPAWVEDYLADPHDLRPHLPETMPRFDLDPAERAAIVAAFSQRPPVPATPPPDPARVAEGEALFVARGCVGCHAFGARHDGPLPLAPDLAHTRERMHPDRVAAWIRDPRALSSEATMPALGLPDAEVLALRDYVLLADPGWTPQPPLGPPPEPVDRPVTWAEVEERVFGRICVHCHMKPELNQGRAGPGNAGGFGWPATGIELQTREGVAAAADLISGALLRRREEAARDAVEPGHRPASLTRPAKPGMPLGLPPIPDEDLALVLAWIEQGMP